MKKLRYVIAAVMLACLLTVVAAADGTGPEEALKIDMKIGYDKFYKLGYSVPLYFELDNRLKDINGELQVEIPTEYETVMLYSVQVSLPKDSVKKLTVNIPMNRFLTKLRVNLTEDKMPLVNKDFRIDPGVNAETFAIGVLSDDYDSVGYINSVSSQGTVSLPARNIKLDETVFPEDLNALNAFNAIVIDNYDTTRLSARQYSVLRDWTMGGGLLLIGTGSSYNKTLAAFKDDFLTGQTGSLKTVKTSALSEYASAQAGYNVAQAKGLGNGQGAVVYAGRYGSGGAVITQKAVRIPAALSGADERDAPDVDLTGNAGFLTLNVLELSLEDGEPVIAEGGFPLVQGIDRGHGKILVAAFGLGMEPMASWIGSRVFADRLLSRTTVDLGSGNYYKGIAEQNIYAMDNAVKNIPELALPKTSHVFVIFALYILLAAPVSYIVLKRLDRRELLWVTVPALSLLFSGMVYISGFGTRMTEPVVNIISVLNFDKSGAATSKTFAGIFTPTKNNILVKAENSAQITPLLTGNNYNGSVNFDETAKKVEAKVGLPPQNTIEFYKTGVWSMKTVTLLDNEHLNGKIEGNIKYAGGSFAGTLKNASGYDMEECYIITANQYLVLGAVKNGETVNVDAKPASYFGNRYDLINAIYKDPFSGPNSPKRLSYEETKAFREKQQKRQVLNYSFVNRDFGSREAILIGWSRRSGAQSILINGKQTKRFEKSLILADIEVSFKNGNLVEYPYGFIQPNIVNTPEMGNFDAMGKTFFGTGTAEIHYPIEKDIKVENIKIKYTTGGSHVKQYIWNAEEGDWEQGDYAGFIIEGGNIPKYIDGDNLLKLKFEISDDNVQLPEISVKGSVE